MPGNHAPITAQDTEQTLSTNNGGESASSATAFASVQDGTTDGETLTGFVVSNESRNESPATANITNPPVPEATIEIEELDRTVQSDLFGFFEFEDVERGTYTLIVSAEGFESVERTVSVESRTHTVIELNRTEQLYTMEFSVEAKGTSIDLREATVSVDDRTRQPDENGSVRFEHLSAGNYSVAVEHTGYESWTDTVSLSPRSKRVSVRMAPNEPHSIAGDVTDEWNRTVDHGTARITGVDGEGGHLVEPQVVQLNETNGTIRADGLPPLPYSENQYHINVTATGYESNNTTVQADVNGLLNVTATGYESNNTTVQADVNGFGFHTTPFHLDQRDTTTILTDQTQIYRDESGDPMPVIDSEVIINGTDDVTGDINIRRLTNQSGQVAVDRLLPGKYEVQFTRYVLYQLTPGWAPFEPGEVISRGIQDGPEQCDRARESGGGYLIAGVAPHYCRPMTSFREVQRTKSIEVVNGSVNEITVNRSTPVGSADISTMGANGTTGENRTRVWSALPDTAVNLTVPDNIDVGPDLSDSASGFLPNIDETNYLIMHQPVEETGWRTDDGGTLGVSLYPGLYGPQAINPVEPSDSPLPFEHFYSLASEANRLWVHPNATTERTLQLYPTWTEVEGSVGPYEIPNATIELSGEGWQPEPGGTVVGTPELRIPEWASISLADSYGGQNKTLRTDSQGEYSARLPIDDYDANLDVRGFENLTTNVTLDRTSPLPVDLYHPLEPSGGNVTKEVIYYIDDCSGTDSYNTTPTLYSPRFNELMSGSNVPAGNYTAYHPDRRPQNITVSPGEDESVTFTAYDSECDDDIPYRNYTLEGTISAATTGSPIEGANVSLDVTFGDGSSPDPLNATTDAEGQYTIEESIPGGQTIASAEVTARNGTEYIPHPGRAVGLSPGEIEVADLVLDSAQGELRLRVENSTGPLSNARVTVGTGPSVNWKPTNETGYTRFLPPDSEEPTVLPVDVGEYEFQVRKPGYYFDGENAGFTANTTMTVASSEDRERYEETVTLREIPDPTIREFSMNRGPSDDTTGLFLEGVRMPTEATATIEPPDIDGLDEPVMDMRLIANRGPEGRGGTVLDSLTPSADRVESVGTDSLQAEFEFDIGELPAGRNNFTVAVRTEHGASTETLLRQGNDPYWIDVLPVPTFLSATLSAARVPEELTGFTNTTDLSLGGSLERQSPNYNWTPEGSIEAEYGDYVSYNLSLGVGVEMRQDNPVDATEDAAESFGFAEQTMPALTIEFDGENRTFSVSGGISFDGSAEKAANIQNPVFSEISADMSWGAGFTTGGETIWEEPLPGGGDFVETFQSRDEVSGNFESDFKALIRNEYVVSALGAPPIAGTWLNRVDTNLYLTAKFGTEIDWDMVYDGPGGLLGYALLAEGEEPAPLEPNESGLDLGVDLGIGAGAQIADHEVVEGNLLPGFTFEFNPLAGSPGFERITGQVDASLKVDVGLSKTWKWDVAGPGTLWESDAATGGDMAAAAVVGPRLFSGHNGIPGDTTASVTPIRTEYTTQGSNRYWRGEDYARFSPTPADSNNSLLTHAYPGAEPSVASLTGDRAQIVYAHDDITAPVLSTALQSTSSETTIEHWNQPVEVPGSVDVRAPEIASLTDGRTVAVWRSTDALDQGVNPLLDMNDTELSFTVFDGEEWHPGETLTNNSVLERNPAVAGDGDQFMTVWTGIRSGYLTDDDDVDVQYARSEVTEGSDGIETVETGRIVEDVSLAGSPAIDWAGDRGLAVYPVAVDDGEQDAAVRLKSARYREGSWSSPTVVAEGESIRDPTALMSAETMEIAWSQNNSELLHVERANGTWTEPSIAVEHNGLRDLSLVGRAGVRALVWRGFGPTARSLYYTSETPSDDGFGNASLLDGSAEYSSLSATMDARAEDVLVTALAEPNATESIEIAPDIRVFEGAVTEADEGQINVTDLRISRTELEPTETVRVTAMVENNGSSVATASYDLAIDGDIQSTQAVTLVAGEGTNITFDASFDSPGEYELTVDGEFVATVTVIEPEDEADDGPDEDNATADDDPGEDDDTGGGPSFLWPLLVLLLLGALAAGYYVYTQRLAEPSMIDASEDRDQEWEDPGTAESSTGGDEGASGTDLAQSDGTERGDEEMDG